MCCPLYSFTSFGNPYAPEQLNVIIYPDTTKISKVNTSNKIKNDSIHRSLVVDSVISYSKTLLAININTGAMAKTNLLIVPILFPTATITIG